MSRGLLSKAECMGDLCRQNPDVDDGGMQIFERSSTFSADILELWVRCFPARLASPGIGLEVAELSYKSRHRAKGCSTKLQITG